LRASGTGVQFFGSFEQGAVMQGRFRSRSIAIGGIFLMVTLTAGVLIEPAHAQAQQADGFNASAPQWALTNPYLFSGLNAGSNIATGTNQQAYTAPFGSGTVGLFVESNVRDGGAGASGTSGNWFGPLLVSPTSQREDWFANLANPGWRTSVFGSYKSAPNAGLFNGLYTTAGFGVTSIRTNPSGFSGLPNFSNDVAAVTARAGLGLQVTPQITVEGSVSWTQVPASTFR
jgi:hypothetical protein